MSAIGLFTREHLRAPFTLALLVGVPLLFVFSAAAVLSEFATVLGGALDPGAAMAMSAGWAAAFVAGALGYFEAVSSADADRRIVIAGLAAWRVALARISASVVLALIASAAGFVALVVRAGVEQPGRAAVGVVAYALLYVGVGVVIGTFVRAPLEGSLLVTFVFILDVFSGTGVATHAAWWSISQQAAEVTIDAAIGASSPPAAWAWVLASTIGALGIAFVAFVFSARRRE